MAAVLSGGAPQGGEVRAARLRASTPPALAARAIRKSYGDRLILDGVSLTVAPGESVAIIGENGAGKSTMMRTCAGLIPPDSGEVSVAGRVGYCPQEPGLFDLLTADEHLAMFAPALGLSREQALSDGHRLLGEFAFPLRQRAQCRHLSGGSRQKLNLALALLGGPCVLLLDEPYQGFDHGAYVSFWEHVNSWKRAGMGVVVVTHLLADQDLVDRVVEQRIAPCEAA
jgi:ABC-2 type transport system ATP-binding protein